MLDALPHGFDAETIIGSGLLVIMLTQQARKLVPPDWLPFVSMGLGAVLQILWQIANHPVTFADVLSAIIVGAVTGGIASGSWDVLGRVRGSQPVPQLLISDQYPIDDTPDATDDEEGLLLDEDMQAGLEEWQHDHSRDDVPQRASEELPRPGFD